MVDQESDCVWPDDTAYEGFSESDLRRYAWGIRWLFNTLAMDEADSVVSVELSHVVPGNDMFLFPYYTSLARKG